MSVSAFPFESLPKLTRDDVAAHTRTRSIVEQFGGVIETALGETLKVPVTVRPSRSAIASPVTIALVAGEHTLAIDVETALAREVVARALSHPAGIDAGKAPSPALQGAFAAVLVHALRKAGVATQVTKPGIERGAIVGLAVSIAGAAFHASITVPERVAASPALQLDFPITLPLVAISCLASRAELGALAPGDVFLAPGLLKTSALAFVAPREERGIAAELTLDHDLGHRVVIGKGRVATHSWEPDLTMSETTNPTLEVALDAPVVVRVELGAVEMKAREWAALAEGDVITLQRKLGEPAILRIAGNEVARGELVQVDGEYGIRITSTHR